MDLVMLHRFPHHATHHSFAAPTSAASHDTHTTLSSMISGVDYLLHNDRSSLISAGKLSPQTYCKRAPAPEMQDLPMEIIQQIFKFLPDIESVHALSATSRLFHRAYVGSQKLVIVEKVLETQFGPLHDVIQLVTLNSSQPAHQIRNPSFSLALANQMVEKGRIANKWVAIYPMLRWRVKPENRRFLHYHETYRLRRAIYRFWLYNSAHSLDFDDGRYSFIGSRFIRQYSTSEIRELDELREIFNDMLTYDCCPSNSTIQLHYAQGMSTPDLLYFGTYDAHPSADMLGPEKLKGRSIRETMVAESWGDYVAVAHQVTRLLCLTPDQLLHFREACTCKAERKRFLEELVDAEGRRLDLHEYASTHSWDTSRVVQERGGEDLTGCGTEWITGEEQRVEDDDRYC